MGEDWRGKSVTASSNSHRQTEELPCFVDAEGLASPDVIDREDNYHPPEKQQDGI